jgi:hypothetical protein
MGSIIIYEKIYISCLYNSAIELYDAAGKGGLLKGEPFSFCSIFCFIKIVKPGLIPKIFHKTAELYSYIKK